MHVLHLFLCLHAQKQVSSVIDSDTVDSEKDPLHDYVAVIVQSFKLVILFQQ